MSVVVDRLTVEYASGGYVVRPLRDLSFTAGAGELVVLLGASGCGKTTLLSVVAGILTPASGTVAVNGIDVTSLSGDALTRYRRHTVGIVFQAFNLVASLTAGENVEVPLAAAGVSRREARARGTALLAQVGLADRVQHRPGDLSGGQQQRVAIARALVHDPPVLLADEPTAHLDYIQVEGVVSLLRSLASGDRIVIVATHDERLVPLADRVIELTPRPALDVREPVTMRVTKGDVLFRQGDPSDLVYAIDKGSIEVVRERADGTEEIVATLRAGQYVGELGPLLGLQRSATARARTAATLTGYTAQAFRDRVGPPGTPDLALESGAPTPDLLT